MGAVSAATPIAVCRRKRKPKSWALCVTDTDTDGGAQTGSEPITSWIDAASVKRSLKAAVAAAR
jgi:hypothetical protein